jgi:hypothetical protein
MASIFKPKRSKVIGRVPTITDLVDGEIGVNIPDQKVYINDAGSIKVIAQSPSGEAAKFTIINSSQALQTNKRYIVDSSSGPLTLTMPTALVVAGDMIEFVDYTGFWNINNVTVTNPGVGLRDALGNLDEFPLYLDMAYSGMRIVYDGTNWRMIAVS